MKGLSPGDRATREPAAQRRSTVVDVLWEGESFSRKTQRKEESGNPSRLLKMNGVLRRLTSKKRPRLSSTGRYRKITKGAGKAFPPSHDCRKAGGGSRTAGKSQRANRKEQGPRRPASEIPSGQRGIGGAKTQEKTIQLRYRGRGRVCDALA